MPLFGHVFWNGNLTLYSQMGCILSISWEYRAQIYLCRHSLWRHLRVFFGSRPIPYFVIFQTYSKILRACLFCPRRYETNLLYSKLRVLMLDDMIKMEFAKFIFKYSNNMLPNFFNNYFIKLENIHNYNTRRKSRNEYLQTSFGTEHRRSQGGGPGGPGPPQSKLH